MSFWRSLRILGLVASLVIVPVCRGVDDPDAGPLKEKELIKAGTLYVLPAEGEVADGMKGLRKLKVKLDMDARQRKELEAKLKIAKNAISSWDHQHRQLLENYGKTTDVGQKNGIVAQANVLQSKMVEGNGYREDIEKQLNGLGAEEKTQFVNQVIDLGLKVDTAQDTYKQLSEDPDVKQTLEKLNQPGKPKVKLGPSPEFMTNAAALKKWRSDVSSDIIPVKHDNQVPVVEVTLNGSLTREMVVDSGASMVCLTADLAKQLNMVPGDKDQTIQFKMADGKEVDAKLMVLKSVRVGQFTVADVDCAVLPSSLVAAEPLLGGTFLNNFIFKMDPKAGELHLAVIAGNTKVTTASGTRDVKKAPGKAASAEKN